MSDWKEVKMPPICERQIGFSIPEDNQFLVVSYEGTHLVTLGDEISVEHDYDYIEYDLYDPKKGFAEYRDRQWQIIGLYPGSPLLTSPQGESLRLDAEHEILYVIEGDDVRLTRGYDNCSGDWAAVTFSRDGMWIILGCPYDVDFVALRRCK